MTEIHVCLFSIVLVLQLLNSSKGAGPINNTLDYFEKRGNTTQKGKGCISSPELTDYVFDDYLEIVYYLIPIAYSHSGVDQVKITRIETLANPNEGGIYAIDVTYSWKDVKGEYFHMKRHHGGQLLDKVANTRSIIKVEYSFPEENYLMADKVKYSEGIEEYFTGLHFETRNSLELNAGVLDGEAIYMLESAENERQELMAIAGQFQGVAQGGRLSCLKLYYQK